MKPFEAQFLAPSQPHKLLWLLPISLALACGGFGLAEARLRQEQQQALRQEAERQRANADTDAALAAAQPKPYAESAADALRSREGPWPYLAALESAECPGTLPVTFSYSIGDESVAVDLESLDLASLTACLQAFNAGEDGMDASDRWRLVDAKQLGERAAARITRRHASQ